ncbi:MULTISPECIES: redox-sensing transcriptional repressor Rex [Caproicibacterium]|uniref:Redox-sensing transcriptional repressor Rex n=1 Tax=Caproicibacterium argilliputei TaxID=3030016 RepID=A0AA97DDA5_9FIRM|nr:redox-sensing transcriptional repressor Rex [Caproicibacterium argilliputei]WOC33398.1 redox-sensing transcriptional repressor Rex [Caproicibacterium argilliputei]
MPKRENISMSVIRRLPRYYRFLNQLKRDGVTRISSTELSGKLGLTASQIRQDLNCFGGFGQQGYGYIVEQLAAEIGHILGVEHNYRTVLFGAGNLGRAIAAHMNFEQLGFELIGIFDDAPQKIGTVIRGMEVLNTACFENFCKEKKPEMAVLCIPRTAVEATVDRLYPLGIHNYWNFSHYDINMKYPNAVVENVHLNDSLLTLCYCISNAPEAQKPQKVQI